MWLLIEKNPGWLGSGFWNRSNLRRYGRKRKRKQLEVIDREPQRSFPVCLPCQQRPPSCIRFHFYSVKSNQVPFSLLLISPLCFQFLLNLNRNFIVLFSYKHGEENRWQPTLTQPLTRLQDGDETSRILLRLIRATPIHELPFLLAWLRDRWVFHSYFHDLFW